MNASDFYQSLDVEEKLIFLKEKYSLCKDSNEHRQNYDIDHVITYVLHNIQIQNQRGTSHRPRGHQAQEKHQQASTSTRHTQYFKCNSCNCKAVGYIDLTNGAFYCVKHKPNGPNIITVAELDYSSANEIIQRRHVRPSSENDDIHNAENSNHSEAQAQPQAQHQAQPQAQPQVQVQVQAQSQNRSIPERGNTRPIEYPVKRGRNPLFMTPSFRKRFIELTGRPRPDCCGTIKTAANRQIGESLRCRIGSSYKHKGSNHDYCHFHAKDVFERELSKN